MAHSSPIVIKLGTSTLTDGTKNLSRTVMGEIARQVSILRKQGKQVIIVTSGAVAAGREGLQNPKKDHSMPFKQMLAAVGQVRLMHLWAELFTPFGLAVGQVLLTKGDLSNRQRYLNIRDTIQSLLHYHVIPIINENDTVATEEIKVGDNDNLSALVSNLIGADLLILLTDQEGLFTSDPRTNKDAKLIPVVDTIDEAVEALAGKTATGLGTGGMATKIQAAKLASRSGTSTVIASAKIPDILIKLTHGDSVGTRFQVHASPKESRKRWLLSERPQGSIVVDNGAAEKLAKQGASLLPIGISGSSGTFERGSIVQVTSQEGSLIAIGITNYSSDELKKLAGIKTDQIEIILGYTYGDEMIHRDNMVLVEK